MAEEWLLTVNDLKHFAYCEAIVYLTHFMGVRETPTEYMEYGREVEREEHMQQLLRKYRVARVLKGVQLVSRELRLAGAPDFILVTKLGELIPVEVKWAEPLPRGGVKRDHVVQLAAYALLIERTWSGSRLSVKRGVVLYLKPAPRFFEVPVTVEDKRAVLGMLKRALDVARGRVEPRTRARCTGCNYYSHCPFRSYE
ncbi:MAG: CRISPR-associated protein Cas4 [Thermofilum sp.]|nr:CRISPR-associated protein Cas4 [Thermofilum sp.]